MLNAVVRYIQNLTGKHEAIGPVLTILVLSAVVLGCAWLLILIEKYIYG